MRHILIVIAVLAASCGGVDDTRHDAGGGGDSVAPMMCVNCEGECIETDDHGMQCATPCEDWRLCGMRECLSYEYDGDEHSMCRDW